MNPKGPVGRQVDRLKEWVYEDTRVEDHDLAEEMAYAEKPYRDHAEIQKDIGKAIVKSAWEKYPDTKDEKVVTPDDIQRNSEGDHSDETIERHVKQAIKERADKKRNKEAPISDRAYNRYRKKIENIEGIDPTAIPQIEAGKTGYQLEDMADASIQKGIDEADRTQRNAEHTAKSEEELIDA